jgi:anti-anti-sigma factor
LGQVEVSPGTPLSISVVPNHSEVAVVLDGELDIASVDQVEQACRELREAGFAQIMLDLRHVGFIDSTGLRTLLALRNAAEQNGHDLALMAPAAHLRSHPHTRLVRLPLTRLRVSRSAG